MEETLPPDSAGAWGMSASTSLIAYRALRADRSRWLPVALDIARSHGLDVGSPHVFSTGTNLVVGLGERLILKIFPPLLHAQFISDAAR